MTYEIFGYEKGAGDYGSNWRRLDRFASKDAAVQAAGRVVDITGCHVLVMTAPKRGIGRCVAQIGRTV